MATDPPNKPNKKTTKRKRRGSQSTSSDASSLTGDGSLYPISKLEQANIEQLLTQALARHKNDELEEKKSKIKEVGSLSSIIEEYLSCFVLVGFTLQNEKVCLFNAHSSKDEGALVDHLRSTFLDIASNRP